MESTRIGPVTLYTGDVTRWAQEYDGPPFHALLSDPPYGISFMGKAWDHGVPSAATWAALTAHLLPGAHLMAFGGDRTFHRLACAIEDAGMEIRRHWGWCHLQGFPKSLDVSKAIDRAAGAERDTEWYDRYHDGGTREQQSEAKCFIDNADGRNGNQRSIPATPEAATWAGFGTDTKPCLEFICCARKPFRGTVAANCLEHGTGALAIDAGRVPVEPGDVWERKEDQLTPADEGYCRPGASMYTHKPAASGNDLGRWPPNLILEAGAAAAMLDRQSGETVSSDKPRHNTASGTGIAKGSETPHVTNGFDDRGGISRMFHRVETALAEGDPLLYQPKAATSEREAGLDHRKRSAVNDGRKAVNGAGNDNPRLRGATERACTHATVKPIDLARKLATLLLPPAEYAPRRILVPFSGVCSEVIGCCLAGWDEVVGIELDPEHVSIGADRVKWHLNQVQLSLFGDDQWPPSAAPYANDLSAASWPTRCCGTLPAGCLSR